MGGWFLTDFSAMVADWAAWAVTIVEDWPDVRQAAPDRTAYEESVRIAERIHELRSRLPGTLPRVARS